MAMEPFMPAGLLLSFLCALVSPDDSFLSLFEQDEIAVNATWPVIEYLHERSLADPAILLIH